MKPQRITDLSYKEVYDMDSGRRLGYVRDAEIDPETGRVTALIIPGKLRWLGLLGREEELVIPWSRIRKLGEDILFVGKRSSLDSERVL